ncbi:hypothetical protein ACFQ3S_00375 [Mucilaginibacter terrae]|uniref:hypothetical protein n=1 Tax=Mucilaginibacter terrae TaxID=1955052 RepID=UPI003638D88E
MVHRTVTLFSIIFALAFSVKAQNILPDSNITDNRIDKAVSYFYQNIGEQAEIYNGIEYLFAPRAYRGNPYYRDTIQFTPAMIKFNDTWYKNIPVLYDDYRGLLVASRPVNHAIFILKSTQIAEFYIEDHHFIHITQPDSANGFLKPGYYESLYNNKTTVLARHYKERSERVVQPAVEVTFTPQIAYYIKKNNIIYNVNSKNSVLKAFKDKKTELAAYLKKNNIVFNDNKALALIKLAAYYDQISQ